MRLFLAVGSVLACTCFVNAQYTVTSICREGGFAAPGRYQINKVGQIAGQTTSDGTHNWPFRWNPSSPNGSEGSLSPLPTGGNGYRAEAHGLNDKGDVVGSLFKPQGKGPLATYKHMAAYWPNGGTPITLEANVFQTEGEGINDAGDIAMLYNPTNSSFGTAVSRVVNGKRKTYFFGANSGWPSDLNQSAQVVILFGGNLWSPNATKTAWSVSLTGIELAWGISDQGIVVGNVTGSNGFRHPAFFSPAVGVTYDLLGDISAALATTYEEGETRGISPNGLMVGGVSSGSSGGEAWIRYQDGTIASLSEPIALGWADFIPNDVNDAGQVVGTSTSLLDGSRYCVLLTP